MDQVEVKWANGPDFAEVAEALALRTEQVASVVVHAGAYFVIFDDGDVPNGDAMKAGLKRDADGILRVVLGPERIPGFFDELEAEIERRLGEAGLI